MMMLTLTGSIGVRSGVCNGYVFKLLGLSGLCILQKQSVKSVISMCSDCCNINLHSLVHKDERVKFVVSIYSGCVNVNPNTLVPRGKG